MQRQIDIASVAASLLAAAFICALSSYTAPTLF